MSTKGLYAFWNTHSCINRTSISNYGERNYDTGDSDKKKCSAEKDNVEDLRRLWESTICITLPWTKMARKQVWPFSDGFLFSRIPTWKACWRGDISNSLKLTKSKHIFPAHISLEINKITLIFAMKFTSFKFWLLWKRTELKNIKHTMNR